MAAPPSVIDIKRSFLNTQIRTLNAPLEPSHDWREHAPHREEGDLKDRIVQEVLQKCTFRKTIIYLQRSRVADLEFPRVVNLVLRHHNRAAYSSQVVHRVAEQIYELYWESGEPDLGVEHEGLETLERGADLKDHKSVNTHSVINIFKLYRLITSQ